MVVVVDGFLVGVRPVVNSLSSDYWPPGRRAGGELDGAVELSCGWQDLLFWGGRDFFPCCLLVGEELRAALNSFVTLGRGGRKRRGGRRERGGRTQKRGSHRRPPAASCPSAVYRVIIPRALSNTYVMDVLGRGGTRIQKCHRHFLAEGDFWSRLILSDPSPAPYPDGD